MSGVPGFLENTEADRRNNRRAEYGDERDSALCAVFEISPLENLARVTRPMLVMQGANQPRVPRSESGQVVAGIRENCLPDSYILFRASETAFSRSTMAVCGATSKPFSRSSYLKRSRSMRLKRILPAVAGLCLAATAAATQSASPDADATVARIMTNPAFAEAVAALDRGHEQWVSDVITITEIPAPPFKEDARARAYMEMFQERGLSDVEIDDEGNVLGLRKGTGGGDVVVVSAHLDTVFPEGTEIEVRRDGDTLHAPGVGDDSAGLATQLSIIDALNAAGIRTRDDILFVGTVGEEGLGDLRGVRHLLTEGKYKDRAKAFVSLDGTGLDSITTGGVGSKRYRVTFKGPGGHSYGAFGIVNPMVAMSKAVVDLYGISVPDQPKTTYSASVVGGGTSVNSIPDEVWMEFDMRSESAPELQRLEEQFLRIVADAVQSENQARSTEQHRIVAESRVIGDRPAGQTPVSSDIVRFATAAYRAEGIEVDYRSSSTDSNVPMSLGIPAITMSRVARGDRAHAPDEWIGVEKGPNLRLKKIGLATILATAGMAP